LLSFHVPNEYSRSNITKRSRKSGLARSYNSKTSSKSSSSISTRPVAAPVAALSAAEAVTAT
jgi:hypothetical protein